MPTDLESLAFPGKHQPIFAARGMVATSQPLATQAGMAMLRRGGNAVDAALATAIALTVVQPASNGIGGDAFALVWDGEKLHGLNGSGRAPGALTVEAVRQRGHEHMPGYGWLSVTVPGAPAAWRDLHARFGKLPFEALFEPAIEYARQGYPVSPISVWHWRWAADKVHTGLTGEEFAGWAPVFAPAGRAPRVGEIWSSPEIAHSLRLIAETRAEAFYHGALAERIVDFAARTGGSITAADFAGHTSTWAEPIQTSYRGYEVWEMPPNGQGLAALLALNLLESFDLGSIPRESVESYHLQLEAMKLAFADTQRYVGDPEHAVAPLEWLLSKPYAAERHALIGERAADPVAGEPPHSDTVYLCTADADGMMVSFIQSTYDSFGSHVVVPGTGIALQNRGSGFSLVAGHVNQLKPGKRPFHTIIPGFLTREGRAVGPFGVMGGHMQPQGHVQMVVNMLDYGMDPQASLDAPRWSWWEQRYVQVEPGAAHLVEGLRARGHEVEIDAEVDWAGLGQIIWRLPSGVYVAGSDGRGDGQAAGF
ncbi:MAG TPA: gamma-glutamyltransferase [Ktedonobacterales bacterium]|jgi:gamma-glutamyltranspeptidase/glutathione hydrolase|nr:gamma-glutamyltransferase [Ktedonobacterales bacterium]